MAKEVGGSKSSSFITKHHPAVINGGEQANGQSVPGHHSSRQKLRGVTPVLVLWHSGRHRVKLKSIAGGPVVLYIHIF